ncbi:MAG: helix-turn-helix domain-containing protein [Acidobacteria bacterium]|nr:helix-turn-helix domain-containing protein [Acidobacteriota bacterium]
MKIDMQQLVSVEEAAALAECSAATIRRAISAGKVPAFRRRGRVFVQRDSAETFKAFRDYKVEDSEDPDRKSLRFEADFCDICGHLFEDEELTECGMCGLTLCLQCEDEHEEDCEDE